MNFARSYSLISAMLGIDQDAFANSPSQYLRHPMLFCPTRHLDGKPRSHTRHRSRRRCPLPMKCDLRGCALGRGQAVVDFGLWESDLKIRPHNNHE